MQDFPKLFQWGPQQKSLTLHALLGKPNKLIKKTLSLASWPTWWWWSKVRSPFHRMRLKLTNEVQALPFLIGHNCGSWKVERLVFFFFSFQGWCLLLESHNLRNTCWHSAFAPWPQAGDHHNCQWQTFLYKAKLSPNLCEAVRNECPRNSQHMGRAALKVHTCARGHEENSWKWQL